jgi:MFS family permease
MLVNLVRQLAARGGRARAARVPQSEEDRNAHYLVLSGASLGLVDGGITTYLPVFLARLGATPTMVSLLTSGQYLMGALTYIPGGVYAERCRDQVQLANRFSLLTRVGYLFIALLPWVLSPGYIPLGAVVLWALTSIPSSVFVPAIYTVFQQAVSPKRRSRAIGARWGLLTVVSATTIPLFGAMLDRVPFPSGYQIVFTLSFVGAVLSVYHFSRLRVPGFVAQPTMSAGGVSWMARIRIFFRPLAESRPFVRYNVATLAFRLAMFLPVSLFSIYWVDNLKATDTWIGLRGGVAYIVLAAGYTFWGRWGGRIGQRTVLIICGASLGLYSLATALIPTMYWLLPVAAIWGSAQSGLDLGLLDMMLAVCPDGRQPSFIAAANMLISVAYFVAPLLGASLAQTVGVRPALLIIGGVQITSAVFFFWLPRREPVTQP